DRLCLNHLMLRAVVLPVKAHGAVEDDFAVLHRDHASGGKAAAVEIGRDMEHDRLRRISAAQKVAVHRMRSALRPGSAAGGQDGLRGNLSAVEAVALLEMVCSAVEPAVDRLEIENRREVVGTSGHVDKLPSGVHPRVTHPM